MAVQRAIRSAFAAVQSATVRSMVLPSFIAPLIAVMSASGTWTEAMASRAAGLAAEKPAVPIH
jgi:hypothetical protein